MGIFQFSSWESRAVGLSYLPTQKIPTLMLRGPLTQHSPPPALHLRSPPQTLIHTRRRLHKHVGHHPQSPKQCFLVRKELKARTFLPRGIFWLFRSYHDYG
ncbi:hypothetical protein L873DRAFT_72927 [Choiromyces venosus 120613-1]|uniref:Uncharacterized protein n=1 Tax=Choiromyces venosus 120613-1 TaxID=1336337 RepID=A0A3N4J8I7_9PEZI|nr:hypothetical protein L873DRAFT_72927 [Choiromyces venosus 120613-1]